MAKDGDEIEIWGDGKQTRSFCYIQDCLEGTFLLMNSDFKDPLNIGSDRLVTINAMADIIATFARKDSLNKAELAKIVSNMDEKKKFNLAEIGSLIAQGAYKNFKKKYLLDSPQGVRGRNSDNTLLKEVLHWEPKVSLEDGLQNTYHWIAKQLNQQNVSHQASGKGLFKTEIFNA